MRSRDAVIDYRVGFFFKGRGANGTLHGLGGREGRVCKGDGGWSIKKFVRTTRRYREVTIKAGEHTLTAADPLPEDLATAINTIHTHRPAHQIEPSRVSG